MILSKSNKTNILNMIAKRNINHDKKRNIFVITTIAFAVCLMMTLSLFIFGKSQVQKIWLQGKYQGAVVNTDRNTIDRIMEDENIELIGKKVSVSTIRIYDSIINIDYYDENALNLLSAELVGRLPEKKNEIAISASYLISIGLDPVINQDITFTLVGDNEEVYRICGLISGEISNRRYGIIVSEDFVESYYKGNPPYEGMLRMKNSEGLGSIELKQSINTCFSQYGIQKDNIVFSSNYFNTIDNSSRDILMIVLVGLFIILASSLVIYNIFYITVVGKIKEYGRFRVIFQ